MVRFHLFSPKLNGQSPKGGSIWDVGAKEKLARLRASYLVAESVYPLWALAVGLWTHSLRLACENVTADLCDHWAAVHEAATGLSGVEEEGGPSGRISASERLLSSLL